MLQLILAILGTFTISMLVKAAQVSGEDTRQVITSNYVTAALIGWLLVSLDGWPGLSLSTLLLGIGGGILWPGTLYLLIWGIGRYGVSLAGSVSRLSLTVPVIFALLFLGERLTLFVTLGLLLAFLALFLLMPLRAGTLARIDRQALWYFPLEILTFGFVALWTNLFNIYGEPAEELLFVTLVFTFSLLFSLLALAALRVRPVGRAWRRGLIIGVPNMVHIFFLLQALQTPLFTGRSAVAYTIYSALGVILVFGGGVFFWREPVQRQSVAGILVAVAAIILLNL